MKIIHKLWEIDLETSKLSKILNAKKGEFGLTCDEYKNSDTFKEAKRMFDGLKKISKELVKSSEYKEASKVLRKMGYGERIQMKKDFQASLV